MGGATVVVGASVAGVRTAQALRTEGHTEPIVVIGAEAGVPYDRPPLSKQVLTGAWDRDRIGLISAAAARSAGIELRLGVAATGLDRDRRRVDLADGSAVSYETLVIATGLTARRPSWPAATGVFALRTADDSAALARRLTPGTAVVCVGAGFIGAEVASAARSAGCDVTLVDVDPHPMARVTGAAVGARLAALHADRGVRTRFGVGVRTIEGHEGALGVELSDGTRVDADVAVVGLGATANVGWLAGSGLATDDGVRCDENLRVGGSREIYACGDVARWFDPARGESVRAEHWTNAVDQARCVAHNIAHPDDLRPFHPDGYIWTDQHDWRVQVVGSPTDGVTESQIGELAGDRPRAAVLHGDADGVLRGVTTVNWPKAMVRCRQLLPQVPRVDAVQQELHDWGTASR